MPGMPLERGVVSRFDGGANPNIKRKETTMLRTTDKIIKHKVVLLNLAEDLGNVSKACQVMGRSRDAFYRYKQAVDEGGVEALFERTRKLSRMVLVKTTLIGVWFLWRQ